MVRPSYLLWYAGPTSWRSISNPHIYLFFIFFQFILFLPRIYLYIKKYHRAKRTKKFLVGNAKRSLELIYYGLPKYWGIDPSVMVCSLFLRCMIFLFTIGTEWNVKKRETTAGCRRWMGSNCGKLDGFSSFKHSYNHVH